MNTTKHEPQFPKVELPKVPRSFSLNLFAKLCIRIAEHQISLFFNSLYMNKLSAGLASVLIISMGGWGFFQFGLVSYEDHIINAQEALTKLGEFTETGALASQNKLTFNLIPTAYAEVEVDGVLEEEVKALVKEVVEETELAIEAIEDNTNPIELQEALAVIDELQDETVAILNEVVEIVQIEEVIAALEEAIDTTESDNAQIEVAVEEVEEAIEAGEDEVTVEVETVIDEDEAAGAEENTDEAVALEGEEDVAEPTKAEKRIESAKALYEEFKASLAEGDGEISDKEQKKLDSIEVALAACEENTEAKDCKSGRIKGLTTALKAKRKHHDNKKEKNEKKYDKNKKGDDEDNSDEATKIEEITNEDGVVAEEEEEEEEEEIVIAEEDVITDEEDADVSGDDEDKNEDEYKDDKKSQKEKKHDRIKEVKEKAEEKTAERVSQIFEKFITDDIDKKEVEKMEKRIEKNVKERVSEHAKEKIMEIKEKDSKGNGKKK